MIARLLAEMKTEMKADLEEMTAKSEAKMDTNQVRLATEMNAI